MKKENIFRQAREQYNETARQPLNRDEAADKLHVSLASLARYETNESVPGSEIVFAMSQLYENPALRRTYCAECCEIGKDDYSFSTPKSLFESGYGLINANKVLEKFKNELFDVLADGIVDQDEIVRLRDIIPQIKKVQKLLTEIEIEIEKHALKLEIDR